MGMSRTYISNNHIWLVRAPCVESHDERRILETCRGVGTIFVLVMSYGTVVDRVAVFFTVNPSFIFLVLLLFQIILGGAAVEGDADMVLALLNAGASASGKRSKESPTPLHAAAKGGRCVNQ